MSGSFYITIYTHLTALFSNLEGPFLFPFIKRLICCLTALICKIFFLLRTFSDNWWNTCEFCKSNKSQELDNDGGDDDDDNNNNNSISTTFY